MYKIEFFSQQIDFIGGCPLIGDVDIVQDHMTFEAFEVTMQRSVGQKKGDLCRISGRRHIMDGIVSDIQPGDGAVTVSVRPLQAIFDQSFFWLGAQQDAAAWLESTLTTLYIDNPDTAAILPLEITREVSGEYIDLDGETVNVLDYIAELLKIQRIAVDCAIDTEEKKINVRILQRETAVTLQADLENVLEKEITIGDRYGTENAAIVADKETLDVIGYWFLHPDGSIDQTDSDRITPVKYATVYATQEDAEDKATQALRADGSDIEIVLLYRDDDLIAQPLTLMQGTQASVYVGGTVYRAVLTGREIIDSTVRLTFGAIRTELTKKLIIEGREVNFPKLLQQGQRGEQSGAGAHNCVYRGAALGSGVTSVQWDAIREGTFEDLFIGDYWTIGGVNYRIAAFDYYLNVGDTKTTAHHVVIVPDTALYNAKMNNTATAAGGYAGSDMRSSGLNAAKTTINNAFGAAHILSLRQYLVNQITDYYPSGGTWYSTTVEIMSTGSAMGWSPMWANADKTVYPLFAMEPSKLSIGNRYWLRDTYGDYFDVIDENGNTGTSEANTSVGVRPYFCIKG